MAPDRTTEQLKECQDYFVSLWFELYRQSLRELGYEDDGEPAVYDWDSFTYCADHTFDDAVRSNWEQNGREDSRIIAVVGHSRPTTAKREDDRLRWHGDSFRREYGESARHFPFDKGHFVAHSLGGHVDNGIFAQRRSINRGWCELGRRFRAMESYAQANPDTFLFSRPIYGDGSLHPFFLEYGVLLNDGKWWIDVFPNRYSFTPYTGRSCWPEWYHEYVNFETEKHRRRVERWNKKAAKKLST